MRKKLCIAFVLSLILLLGLKINNASAAEKGGLDGIDYTRIFSEENSRKYTANINFGGVNIKGKLTWKGKLEGAELDDYIMAYLNENGIALDDMKSAQKNYDAYLNMYKMTSEEVEKIAVRIGGIMFDGLASAVLVDAGRQIITGNWSFEDPDAWRNTLSLFSDPWKATETVILTVLDWTPGLKDDPLVSAGVFTYSLVTTCYDAYKDDLNRWDTRIKGVVADRCLKEFYKNLNDYLMDKVPDGGQWVLNFDGSTTRRFTFMGVKGNKQTWNVYINLIKTQNLSTYHGSPAGVYEGVASMELEHDMSAFSNKIWNLKLGRLKKNWYTGCDTLYVDGQKVFNCSNDGGIYVYRFLCSSDAKVYIYTDRLAEGMFVGGSGVITASMEYGSFDDYQTLSSDRTAAANTATGFKNSDDKGTVVGYVIADVAYHVEPNGNDSLTIVQDKGSAEVGLLFNQTKVNDGTREIITFWDKNIWAPLKSKKAIITIKAR